MWSWIKTQKKKINGKFWLEKLLIRLHFKILWACKAKVWGTMWVLINALCKPSLRAPGHVTKMLHAENGQKVDEFELIYLGNYRYWWKMVCGFWAHYQPPLVWLCSFTPTWKPFFLFCIFFLTFVFFSFSSSAFPLLLNRETHWVQSLSDWRYQGGLVNDWNQGCQVWRIPFNRVLQKFWTFKPLE